MAHSIISPLTLLGLDSIIQVYEDISESLLKMELKDKVLGAKFSQFLNVVFKTLCMDLIFKVLLI